MTNLESILTNKEVAKTLILKAIESNYGLTADGRLMPCGESEMRCAECRFKCVPSSLGEVTEEEWLNEEYQEPLPFPINTVLVAKNWRGQSHVFYYKGRDEHGCHCGSAFYENDEGVFTFDIATARKVGE